MLTVSREVQPCTHADSTLCAMRYWLVPLVTGLFRLLLACSLVVPLVTDLFLARSACYWLVPLVPCFRNVGLYHDYSQSKTKASVTEYS